MQRKRLTVMWMPSASSGPRTFSISNVYLYICLSLVVISWLLLSIGAFLGHRLYHDSAELREQNVHLLGEVKDLETLRHSMEQIQKDEGVIRNFLGVDGGQEEGGGLGQGGEPSPDLSTIDVNDAMTISRTLLPTDNQSSSIAKKAQQLQTSLQKLAEIMRDQRQLLDSTPSIVPLKTDKYWFSSSFGWRRSPFTGVKEFHNGMDIVSHKGTPIIAPAHGMVSKKSKHRYLGKYLRLDHGRGVTTTYGHLSSWNVERGQQVKRGEVIAYMGNTGRSNGTHLHYTVKVKNRAVNPFHYILNTKKNRLVDFTLKADVSNH
jgi:hypothetical protein